MIRFFVITKFILWDKKVSNASYTQYLSRIDGNHHSEYPQYYNISSVESKCDNIGDFRQKNNKIYILKDII